MARTGSIATHRMVRLVLVWLGVGSLYILTAAGNRSEVDDAFAYADAVENASWSGLVSVAHTSHLLFLPGWRLSYAATSALGLDWRAYDVMRVANSFIAAGAVLMLFAVLHGRFGSSTFAAGAAAACFGLSYGFWRYANEGDAYPLAALAVLTYCWLVFSEDGGLQPAVLAGVAAAFAVLIHILGVIPAVTVAPIVYLATKRVGPLVAFVVTFGGVCLATTFSTFLIARDVAMSYPS
jgi:hypothetical protein